ncbi:MAG TPA: dihydropteroate synthase [Acidimicrobiia bacterium]|nr:dihydropteroate synthase [Acidimicrobiia bacterium]
MFTWASLNAERPAVMGIVNVTPDSFSDGGRYLDEDAAVAHGHALAAAGAAVLDVGGESTRPGAAPVDEAEERRRVIPVVERLAGETAVPVSIDTTKPTVAAAALDAGAVIVNDVSAARFHPALLEVVADRGAGYVAMHMLGEPRTMQDDPRYTDVVAEVGDFLLDRLDAARAVGVPDAALAADPGIGFGKTPAHNLALLAQLRDLCDRVDVPVLVGASRKRFLGELLHAAGGTDNADLDARDDATLAAVVWAVDHGARILRVHAVRPAARAVALLTALDEAAA